MNIFPLSYSIPSDVFIQKPQKKIREIAPLNPSDRKTYIYTKQDEYYQMYAVSKYGKTRKKGGWDCLRHYEIIASHCLPLFVNLHKCPEQTMISFPKKLLIEVYNKWENKTMTNKQYNYYLSKVFNYAKKNLTCKKSAEYFLYTLLNKTHSFSSNKYPKILMLNGAKRINYSRELISIGLRKILGKNFIEYPKNNPLYKKLKSGKNHKVEKLYGKGFTYSRILDDINIDRTNIKQRIIDNEFDIIIYGLFGASEGKGGDIRLNAPFWDVVKNNYNKHNIVFIYGGDKMHSKKNTKHLKHLLYHSKHGICFVRELDLMYYTNQ